MVGETVCWIRHSGWKAVVLLLVAAQLGWGQLWKLSQEELVEMTKDSPFERFTDGRPKVPDELLQKLRDWDIGIEDIIGLARRNNYESQFETGWQVLNPQTKLVGRAFTVQFMPARPDLAAFLDIRGRMRNQTAIDMLQEGDVPVVDLYGKIEGGTFVGDKLAYYVWKTTGTGVVLDGSMFYVQNIQKTGMPAYYRGFNPSSLRGASLTGVNIPVQIGDVTVMPGDIVFGNGEATFFIPPALVQELVTSFASTRSRYEWIKKKFDEKKYKSSEIYGRPKDPELLKEMEEYVKSKESQP
jgi:regulator of RNase E activity RraA